MLGVELSLSAVKERMEKTEPLLFVSEMPETSGESARCGQQKAQLHRDKKIKQLEEPRSTPPPPPPPQAKDVVSPPASGSQKYGPATNTRPAWGGGCGSGVSTVIHQSEGVVYMLKSPRSWSSMEGIRQKQQRPSVLRQVSQAASRRQHVHPENTAAFSTVCKEEVDAGRLPQSSSPHIRSSHRQSHHYYFPLRGDSLKQSSIDARLHDGMREGSSVLFASGLCRWPGCDAVSEDFPSFLKHLHSEHSHGDRSIAQWKIQKDFVQRMETQLIQEKQKLIAMQVHLHLSEHKYTDLAASEWSYSLLPFQPQPPVTDGDGAQQWGIKHLEELSQHAYGAAGSAHLLPDLVPSIECYKYNNIRPPYTYAYLIRWSILESPDKQRTLNEIYNWFTTMFFYFRHNTATWKNAVRHNLSLHKCFVRVEGGKGAVWTVDETEYQRRKGQKYHRDCPVKWLKSYSRYYPEDP